MKKEEILKEWQNAKQSMPKEEKPKFEILALPEMEGKKLWEVYFYVNQKYPGRLAQEEHREEFIKAFPKPDLPDWTWCYFMGTVLCFKDGNWDVPYVRWFGGEWYRYAGWLTDVWGSSYRVVLLGDSCS